MKNQELKHILVDTAEEFIKKHMNMTPESVQVSIHTDYLMITFPGVISPAEKEYAENPSIRKLLVECNNTVYNSTKYILESKVEKYSQRRVKHSFIRSIPESRNCIIVITFQKKTVESAPVGSD